MKPGSGASFNPWVAMGRVLVSPGDVFDQLADRPSIYTPYVAGLVLGSIATAISLPTTISLMEAEVASQGLQGESSFSVVKSWMTVGAVIGALVGPWLTGLFVTGIVVGMVWLKGQATSFRTMFSIIGYARLPLSVGAILTAILMTHATTMEEVRQISFSPAILAPAGTPLPVIGMLSALGFFDLWYLFMVVVGVASATRSPLSKSLGPAALLFSLNLLLAMLGSGLSGVALR